MSLRAYFSRIFHKDFIPTDSDLIQAIQLFHKYYGNQCNEALTALGKVLNEHAKNDNKRISALEQKIDEGFSARPPVGKEVKEILKQVDNSIASQMSEKAGSAVEKYLESPKGEQAVQKALAPKITLSFLKTPRMQTELKEIFKPLFHEEMQTKAGKGFLEIWFDEIKEKGLKKIPEVTRFGKRILLGTGAVALIATLTFLAGAGIYTNYLIKKVEKQTDVQKISEISQQVSSLSDTSNKYHTQILKLESGVSGLSDKSSGLNQQVVELTARQYGYEETVTGVQLDNKAYRLIQENKNEASAKQNKQIDERLISLEDNFKDYQLKLVASLARFSSKIEPLERAIQVLEKDGNTKWASYEADRKVYQAQLASADKVADSLKQLRKDYDLVKETYSELEKSQAEQNALLNSLKTQIDGYKQKIASLEEKLENLGKQN